jgi:hypothetical protein
VVPLRPDQRSRQMDAAILYRWSTGQQAIILQVEHWSRSRDLDLRRALCYTADLAVRYPEAAVIPVMVLCDRPAEAPPDRLVIAAGGFQTVAFQVVLFQVVRDVLARWQVTPTPFLAVLCALADDLPPAERGMRALGFALRFGAAFAAQAFEPIDNGASIRQDEAEHARFYDYLRRDHTMTSVIELLRAEGKAEGMAEGKAEAALAMLRRRIARDALTIDAARAEVEDLCREGDLTRDEADRVLARLG